MSRVGFEPMIPAFERAKTVHALDRAATVIGFSSIYVALLYSYRKLHVSLIHTDVAIRLMPVNAVFVGVGAVC
jgi:hypothetical protein